MGSKSKFNKKTRNIAGNNPTLGDYSVEIKGKKINEDPEHYKQSFRLSGTTQRETSSSNQDTLEVPSHRRLITRHLGTRLYIYIYAYLKLLLEFSQDTVLGLARLPNTPMKLSEESCQVQVSI